MKGAVGHSWMLPNAKTIKKLLYISDFENGNVYVFNYATGLQVGGLSGFDNPTGQCEDVRGDIFIANTDANNVIEYAHGGTRPLKTFSTDGYPNGCSISRSGDLAVTNEFTADGPGNVQVFKNASGTPIEFENPSACYYLQPGGHDNKGNFYAEGATTKSNGVCEVAAKSKSLKVVSFDSTIYGGGSVMWDGKYITLTDVSYKDGGTTAIYQAKRSASGGLTTVGTTQLTVASCTFDDVIQPFIVGNSNTPLQRKQAKTVIGTPLACHGEPLASWHYPAGGDSFKEATEIPGAEYVSVSFAR